MKFFKRKIIIITGVLITLFLTGCVLTAQTKNKTDWSVKITPAEIMELYKMISRRDKSAIGIITEEGVVIEIDGSYSGISLFVEK